MSKIIAGPFSRIEGDLEIRLDIEAGQVRRAEAVAPMYRGFEDILVGKSPKDAVVIVPRICGICSVAQSVAVARAIGSAYGAVLPQNAKITSNLTLATEILADFLIHFYVYFLPDFVRDEYQGREWYSAFKKRFGPGGMAHAKALQERKELLKILGILAGRWPHTLSVQPGGSTRPVSAGEKIKLEIIVDRFRRFVESKIFGLSIDEFLSFEREDELVTWAEFAHSDLAVFVQIMKRLGYEKLGSLDIPLMSTGSFESLDEDEPPLFRAGIMFGEVEELDLGQIKEDISHAYYRGPKSAQKPEKASSLPYPDKPGAYSFSKAPRLNNQPVEVGAMARQCVDGQPLIQTFQKKYGASVYSRVFARWVEAARMIQQMQSWVEAIEPKRPFYQSFEVHQKRASGIGVVEAARGTLLHFVNLSGGKIVHYQVIAPTTFNFSPRDHKGRPGPVEAALEGLHLGPYKGTEPIEVAHVVRSFDPCMYCTVH